MLSCGVTKQRHRQLNLLPQCRTFLGSKMFSDKIALVRLEKKSKWKSKKLNSALDRMNSNTKLVTEPEANGLQESELRNFTNETTVKISKSPDNHNKGWNCKMFIPGSGAIGTTKCLYFRMFNVSYLFNCGEDIQKSSCKSFMLKKVKNIFISNLVWGNIGGLAGFVKLVYNMNEKVKFYHEVKIHGPPGLEQLYEVFKSLIYLKGQEIEFVDTTKDKLFDDGNLKIQSVPLYPLDDALNMDNAIFKNDEEYNETKANSNILTMIEHFLLFDYFGLPLKSRHVKPNFKINDLKLLMSDMYRKRKASICYICKTREGQGRLDLELCVNQGVSASVLGTLKKGEDVTLPNGNVVRYADVSISANPSRTFAVVDCPEEAYLDSLLKEPSFKKLQTEEEVILIVHFTPPSVMNHPKYVEWMKSFPPGTKHLRINEENICIGHVPSHAMQTKLNLIHGEIFPKLPNPAIPVVSMSDYSKDFKLFDSWSHNDLILYKIEQKLKKMEDRIAWEPLANLKSDILEGKSNMVIDISNRCIGSDVSFFLCPEQYVREALEEPGAVEALENFKKESYEMERSAESTMEGDYPKVLFLGTGSGCPRTIRNSSGILVFVNEDICMLLDCGEGTYNRINVLFGREKTDEILLKLKAVYVSHMHSDHHFGLIEIIKGRKRAINNLLIKGKYNELPENQSLSKAEIVSKLNIKPMYLLAPYRLLDWLSFYDMFYEKLKSDFTFISNGEFDGNSHSRNLEALNKTKEGIAKKKTGPEVTASFLQDVGVKEFQTCLVKHCFGSFAVTFTTNNNYKISYSGDCVPSQNFIKQGANSDLLIHEATYENDLSTLANTRNHSTIAQALSVSNLMKAKFTLLTHFSQRYRYVPLNTETFPDNVAISFDFMMVSMKQLTLLPKCLPLLRIIFGDDIKISSDKTIKKKLRSSVGNEELDQNEKVFKRHYKL